MEYENEVKKIRQYRAEYEILNPKRKWDDMISQLESGDFDLDSLIYMRCNLQIIRAREKAANLSEDEMKKRIKKLFESGMAEKDIQFEVGLNWKTIRHIIDRGYRDGEEKS